MYPSSLITAEASIMIYHQNSMGSDHQGHFSHMVSVEVRYFCKQFMRKMFRFCAFFSYFFTHISFVKIKCELVYIKLAAFFDWLSY